MTGSKYFNASSSEIEQLGFDPDALLEKYDRERDKRIRPDGISQYISSSGTYGDYADDPYVEKGFTRDPVIREIDVVIIGGGLSGWSTAAQLRLKGVKDICIIDKAGDFGGAWYWNRYPGIRCDVESYIYLPLLEEVGYVPTEKYATGREIFDHVRNVARQLDLYDGALFQTQVTEARWQEDLKRWQISTDRGDNLYARFLVKTNAKLDLPKLPGIPGIARFEGKAFHTSRWDYDYTGGSAAGELDKLHDKVVAVIGTGCTAIQCIPHLAKTARQLLVFQRTPSSVDIRNNRPTDPDWAKGLGEGWQKERRRNFISITSGGADVEDLVDDSWTAAIRAVGGMFGKADGKASREDADRAAMIADFRQMNRIRDRVSATVSDVATAESLKPWYRQFCKRPAFSDEYLPAFNRSNVKLVDTDGAGIEEIKEHSIVANGAEYEVDCIIFATGFEVGTGWAHRSGCEIFGRGGKPLFQSWNEEGIRTLHGIFSHGFPNLFHLSTIQAGISYSHTFVSDAQSEHIADLISDALRDNVDVLEPERAAEEHWIETINGFPNTGIDFQKSCTPSYVNNEGDPTLKTGLIASGYRGSPLDYCDILVNWRRSEKAGLHMEFSGERPGARR